MTANLVPLPTPDQTYSRDQIELVKRTLAKGASDDELALFLGTAKRMGLDPFAQQIRAIRRKEYNAETNRYEEKLSIEPGIDGFRLIAARTGQLEGRLGPHWCGPDGKWVDAWLQQEPPAAAKVGVLRKGFREPLWAVALWREYRQTKRDGGVTRMWSDRPAGQLAKCAESLALRAAFPHELGGVYTSDEMAQADREQPTAATYEVIEGGVPTEATIYSLQTVTAAKELVTRPEVSDRYREAVKVAEVDTFGEVWEDFWRLADLKSWVEILLAARLTVAPRAIEQTADPASAPPRGLAGSATTSEARPAAADQDPHLASDTNASVTGPGDTDVPAGHEPPNTEASTSPPSPASPGDGGDTKAGRGRARGPGKAAESPPPAGPTQAEAAEQAAFEQSLASDEPGGFAR